MIRRVLGWFRLGRNDPILISTSLLFFVALFTPMAVLMDVFWVFQRWSINDNLTLISWVSLLGLLLGLSALPLNPRAYRLGDRVGVLVAVGLMVVGLCWSSSLYRIMDAGRMARYGINEDRGVDWLGWKGIAFLIASFIVSAALMGLTSLFLRLASSRIGQTKLTRTRILIGAAVILFVAAMIKNVFGTMITSSYEGFSGRAMDLRVSSGDAVGSVWNWLLLAILYLLWVLLPGTIVSRLQSFWYRVLVVGLFCGGIGGVALAFITGQTYDPTLPCFAIIVFSLSLAIPFILISPLKRDEADLAKESVAKPNGRGMWSPVWTSLIVVLLVSAVVLINRYDPLTLFSVNNSSRWSIARKMRTFNSDRNTGFFGTAFKQGAQSYAEFIVEFTPESEPDFLERFEEFPLQAGFTFSKINSELDLRPLSKINLFSVRMENSRLTKQQFGSLLNRLSYIDLSDVRIDDTSEESSQLASPMLGWLMINKTRSGELAKILRQFQDFKSVGMLSVSEVRCTLADWKELVRASQDCPVRLNSVELPKSLLERWTLPESQSLSDMEIFPGREQGEIALRLLFDTDAVVRISAGAEGLASLRRAKLESFWPIALIMGDVSDAITRYDSETIERDKGVAELRKDLANHAKANYWSMAEDQDGAIESFYFPGLPPRLLKDLSALPNLKRLSLDWSWVNSGLLSFDSVDRVDFSDLGMLTALEALYLPTNIEPVDLSFLGKLINLKELQMSPNRTMLGKPGFEQCQSLKKLTLLNSPNGQVLKEIAKLKSLEELVIVDFGYAFSEPKSQTALRAKFPNLKITIVDSTGYSPIATEEFEKHLKRIKSETRKRLFVE